MRIVLATLVMGGVVAVAASMREAIIAPFTSVLPVGGKELAVLLVSGGAFMIFVVTAFILRAVTLSEIRGAFRRPPPSANGGGALPPGLDG